MAAPCGEDGMSHDDSRRHDHHARSRARHEPLSEEELRAQLEEELRRITVRDVLLQTIVSLVNLGGQRLGLAPGAEDMRDLEQVRLAIEGVRALLPLVEEQDAEQVRPIRDALSQLQMAYAAAGAGRRAYRRRARRGRQRAPGRRAAAGRRPGTPRRRRRASGSRPGSTVDRDRLTRASRAGVSGSDRYTARALLHPGPSGRSRAAA